MLVVCCVLLHFIFCVNRKLRTLIRTRKKVTISVCPALAAMLRGVMLGLLLQEDRLTCALSPPPAAPWLCRFTTSCSKWIHGNLRTIIQLIIHWEILRQLIHLYLVSKRKWRFILQSLFHWPTPSLFSSSFLFISRKWVNNSTASASRKSEWKIKQMLLQKHDSNTSTPDTFERLWQTFPSTWSVRRFLENCLNAKVKRFILSLYLDYSCEKGWGRWVLKCTPFHEVYLCWLC